MIQDFDENVLNDLSVFRLKSGFHGFYVPIAELLPEEVVYRVSRYVEVVPFKRFCNGFYRLFESREDPSIDHFQVFRFQFDLFEILEVQKDEPRRVPDLVRKPHVGLEVPLIELYIPSLSREDGECEPQRIRSVLIYHLERVYSVSKGLAHLPSVLVADELVDVDVAERFLTHELVSHHYHSRDPEEDYVEARDEEIRRVVPLEVFGLLGPAECRERPEGRGEPGVENVLVLLQVRRAALLTLLRGFLGCHDVSAVLTVPDRYPVTPPELPRDAPVPYLVHPVKVNLSPALREELYLSLLDGLYSLLGEGLRFHEPLVHYPRLYRRSAPVAVPDRMPVILDFHQVSLFFQILDYPLSRLVPVESCVLPSVFVYPRVVIHYIYDREVVVLSYEEVRRIMAGGDLERPRSELRIDPLVGYYR